MTDAKQQRPRARSKSPKARPMNAQPMDTLAKSPNEGEGNRTAAQQYNEAAREFVESGKVDQQAEAARRAVEGRERDELERAETAGRERMKEEDPNVHRGRGHED
jgi:hypothetical protein